MIECGVLNKNKKNNYFFDNCIVFTLKTGNYLCTLRPFSIWFARLFPEVLTMVSGLAPFLSFITKGLSLAI